ncbi:MAG: S9 family peptidase, partial [Verrucomicrobia subdivision 3 bacterium]|nr:S9 family peptidase [Limisphaerales bacterium]
MGYRIQISAVCLTLISFADARSSLAQLPVVPTAREPVTNTYHGTPVIEDYQWLETATNVAVRDWTRQQNERTRAYFAGLPFYAGLAQALEELILEESASYALAFKRGDNIFALRHKPPAQQPVLVRLNSVYPPALRQVVFDPNAWNSNGTTAMDWFVPSPDGRLVAICLSEKGSEDGTLHFFATDSGRQLPDTIPGVQYPTGGGSAAWKADGTGAFYTRYPRPGERPEADRHFYQQVWFHKLGTPESADTFEIGREFPRIAEIDLEASEDGQ